jgi:hypothetical protein
MGEIKGEYGQMGKGQDKWCGWERKCKWKELGMKPNKGMVQNEENEENVSGRGRICLREVAELGDMEPNGEKPNGEG